MELIGLETGRLTLLVDVIEVSPLRGHALKIVERIRQRYGFTVAAPSEQPDPNVVRFEDGLLPDGQFIKLFEVHPQGLVIQSNDTASCDAFLEDILLTGQAEFDLRAPSSLAKKVYMSNIVVEFNRETRAFLEKLAPALSVLSARLKELYGVTVPLDLARLAIKPDPSEIRGRLANLLPDFAIERRVYAPHSSERFYSVAPLPTAQHIEFLKHLELTM